MHKVFLLHCLFVYNSDMKNNKSLKSLFRVVILTLVMIFALQSSGCFVEMLLGAAAVGALASSKKDLLNDVQEAYPYFDIEEKTQDEEKGHTAEEELKHSEEKDHFAHEAKMKDTIHEDVSFYDIQYIEPDLDTLEKDLDDLLADIGSSGGNDTETLLERFDALLDTYNAADSVSAYAYVRYAQNVNDETWQKRSDDISLRLTKLDLKMTDCALALMDLGPQARERWGDDFCNCVIAGDSLNDESVQELFEKEQELSDRYDVLISSYKVTYKGKTYSQDDLNRVYEEKGWDTYHEIYTAYTDGLNKEAGNIYLELLSVRTEIANRLGYNSYADYRYDAYFRDYSTEDAAHLASYVKKYITPVFYMSILLPYYVDLYDGSDEMLRFDDFRPKLKQAISNVSPEMVRALEYLINNENYDMTPDDNKMESSFSTYMSADEMPFIFMQWEDDQRSAQTLTHEFGHFCNFYFNAASGWSVTDPLDLCEIDSQGLEMLLMDDFDSFYGKGADYARVEQISDALYSLVTGCMEDEFQQYAYAHPDSTLDELNDFYKSLCDVYGLSDIYGVNGTEWARIPHSFSSPMYYISYATSVVPALEIWELAETDREAAIDAYLSIMNREAYPGFRETVISAGLSDPFAESTIKELAWSVSSYLNSFNG